MEKWFRRELIGWAPSELVDDETVLEAKLSQVSLRSPATGSFTDSAPLRISPAVLVSMARSTDVITPARAMGFKTRLGHRYDRPAAPDDEAPSSKDVASRARYYGFAPTDGAQWVQGFAFIHRRPERPPRHRGVRGSTPGCIDSWRGNAHYSGVMWNHADVGYLQGP